MLILRTSCEKFLSELLARKLQLISNNEMVSHKGSKHARCAIRVPSRVNKQ